MTAPVSTCPPGLANLPSAQNEPGCPEVGGPTDHAQSTGAKSPAAPPSPRATVAAGHPDLVVRHAKTESGPISTRAPQGSAALDILRRFQQPRTLTSSPLSQPLLSPILVPEALERIAGQMLPQFPQAEKILTAGGVHPYREVGLHNPYASGALDAEDFTNVGRHCVAVAFGAKILAQRFAESGHLTPNQADQVTERALVHDAGKRFEVLRKKSMRQSEKAYRPNACEQLGKRLADQGMSVAMANHLTHAGAETGHLSLRDFIALEGNEVVLDSRRSLAEKIVHLVDDMTYSPRDRTHIAAFKSCAERMESSKFPKIYPFLYTEGLGFDSEGQVVHIDNMKRVPPNLQHVQTYAQWQVEVADRIESEFARMLGDSESSHPSRHVVLDLLQQGVSSEASGAPSKHH